jgi:hypothetical protein
VPPRPARSSRLPPPVRPRCCRRVLARHERFGRLPRPLSAGGPRAGGQGRPPPLLHQRSQRLPPRLVAGRRRRAAAEPHHQRRAVEHAPRRACARRRLAAPSRGRQPGEPGPPGFQFLLHRTELARVNRLPSSYACPEAAAQRSLAGSLAPAAAAVAVAPPSPFCVQEDREGRSRSATPEISPATNRSLRDVWSQFAAFGRTSANGVRLAGVVSCVPCRQFRTAAEKRQSKYGACMQPRRSDLVLCYC